MAEYDAVVVPLKPLGDNVLFLVIDSQANSMDNMLGVPGRAYQIVDTERPTTYIPMGLDNRVRWEFRINPDARVLDNYQKECFEPTKGLIKEALMMGRLLFNTSGPANMLRSTIFKLRRKKPIDISNKVMPRVAAYPGRNVPKSTVKHYPKVSVTLPDGQETILLFTDVFRHRVLCRDITGLDQLADLHKIDEMVRPNLYHLVTKRSSAAGQATEVVVGKSEDLKKLFPGEANYVVVGLNNTVLGVYDKGDEARLIKEYRDLYAMA